MMRIRKQCVCGVLFAVVFAWSSGAAAEDSAETPEPALNTGTDTQWNLDALKGYYRQVTGSEAPSSEEIYQWARGDLKNATSWEYKLLRLPSAADFSPAEQQLNALGAERWECISVVSEADALVFVFKRLKKSLLRSLPLRELIKMVPSGGSE